MGRFEKEENGTSRNGKTQITEIENHDRFISNECFLKLCITKQRYSELKVSESI